MGPITQTPSDDGTVIFVEGTVRNVGSRESRDLVVWVNGLDADGRQLARRETFPVPRVLAPGTAATYVVRMPGDEAIRRFHVEVEGRDGR